MVTPKGEVPGKVIFSCAIDVTNVVYVSYHHNLTCDILIHTMVCSNRDIIIVLDVDQNQQLNIYVAQKCQTFGLLPYHH